MAAIGRMPPLGSTTPYQESMSMGNNSMGMNEQLLHQMMMMRRGNGGSLGVSPSFPTSRMIEELRRQVATANNSNSQTLPDLPFLANGGRGGGGNDDPVLPEYGYGDE
jgi:hypothetical protein